MEIRCNRVYWNNSIDVAFINRLASGLYVGTPLKMQKIEEGSFVEPTVRIDVNAAQQLMDELWVCGLRPSEGSGSAGSLAATERHLSDMQKVAFGLLKRHGVDR